MTATVAARLIEKGRITWDTTIGQAMPELAGAMRKEYRKVTLAQLLRHESGLPREVPMQAQSSETALRLLPNDMPTWILQDYDTELSPTENRLKGAIAVLALPSVGPRGKSEYSNAGLMVAGLMLEKAAGMSFEKLFEQQLLIPLGMRSTGFGPTGFPGKRDEPWGHWPTGDSSGPVWRALDPGDRFADNPPSFAPNGRAHASLQDVALFASAYLAGERGKAGLLSVESFRKLHTPNADGTAMATPTRLEQEAKAELPMLVMPYEMATFVRLPTFENAELPMLVTGRLTPSTTIELGMVTAPPELLYAVIVINFMVGSCFLSR